MHFISEKKKYILIVSDEPRVLAEMKKMLMNDFGVRMAALEGALSSLEAYEVDAVAAYIGPKTRLASFQGVLRGAAARHIPVLFWAASDSAGDEAAAFAMGAVDYAVKRQTGGTLSSRLRLRIRANEAERMLAAADGGEAARPGVPPENSGKAAMPPKTSQPGGNAGMPPDGSEAKGAAGVWAGKTILIADDVALNREIIEIMLSEIEGLTLDFASGGGEAVQKAAQNAGRYCLILMDIQMPDMDGLTAARAIRCQDSHKAREIPIIALTASVSEDDIAGFTSAGMNGYIEKPLDHEKFSACVKYL